MKNIKKRQRKYGNSEQKQQNRLKKRNKIINIHNLIDKKKYDLALYFIEDYIKDYSKDCYVIHEYGRYFLKQSDLEKAKYYFLLNVENNEENKYYAMYELGQIAKFEYNYDLSINYYNEIINSKHKEKCYSLLEIAKLYILKEKYKEGEKILLEIIKQQMPNFTYALEELIELKLSLNEINEAQYYLDILKANNKLDKCEYLEGKIEVRKGNIKKGKIIFEKIENSNNQFNINAKIELAKIEHQLCNYTRSIELLDEVDNSSQFILIDCIFLYITNYIALREKNKAREKIEQLEKCGEEYKNDVIYFLAKLELIDKNYEKGYQYLEQINEEKIKTYKSAKLQQTLILLKQEKYNESYEKFQEFCSIKINNVPDQKEKTILIYFNKLLNLNLNLKINYEHYIERMILNYNKDEVITHISKHKQIINKKTKHTLLYENIDIEQLYDYAYNNISEDNFIDNVFVDSYILKYEKVGFNEYRTFDYIKVITLPNSKEIITIYPCDKIDMNNNLIEEQEDIKQNKIKKISQIDKFNRKYKLS